MDTFYSGDAHATQHSSERIGRKQFGSCAGGDAPGSGEPLAIQSASGDQHGDTSGDSPGRGDCPTHDFPLQVLERSRAVALAFLANPEEL